MVFEELKGEAPEGHKSSRCCGPPSYIRSPRWSSCFRRVDGAVEVGVHRLAVEIARLSRWGLPRGSVARVYELAQPDEIKRRIPSYRRGAREDARRPSRRRRDRECARPSRWQMDQDERSRLQRPRSAGTRACAKPTCACPGLGGFELGDAVAFIRRSVLVLRHTSSNGSCCLGSVSRGTDSQSTAIRPLFALLRLLPNVANRCLAHACGPNAWALRVQAIEQARAGHRTSNQRIAEALGKPG